jgi:hypothetical protein
VEVRYRETWLGWKVTREIGMHEMNKEISGLFGVKAVIQNFAMLKNDIRFRFVDSGSAREISAPFRKPNHASG